MGKYGAISRKGRVCGALACANDFDLLLLGAAPVEVFVAVGGVPGLLEFLLIQASAASFGVTEAFHDPQASLWLPPGGFCCTFWYARIADFCRCTRNCPEPTG